MSTERKTNRIQHFVAKRTDQSRKRVSSDDCLSMEKGGINKVAPDEGKGSESAILDYRGVGSTKTDDQIRQRGGL